VSNVTDGKMRAAAGMVQAPLVTNQVAFHPLPDQSVLVAAVAETGIPLSAFAPVARDEVFRHPLVAQIGAGHGKSAAQVVLRWVLQKGVSLNTMSTSPANIAIMDFTLSSVDMARIGAMGRLNLRVVGRNAVPWAPDRD
jgi:2,5-diketo-D-gluconate reductase B